MTKAVVSGLFPNERTERTNPLIVQRLRPQALPAAAASGPAPLPAGKPMAGFIAGKIVEKSGEHMGKTHKKNQYFSAGIPPVSAKQRLVILPILRDEVLLPSRCNWLGEAEKTLGDSTWPNS